MPDVSGLVPEARSIVQQVAGVYLRHTAPWFIGLIVHGSAVKGGVIPNCSDIDFQLYLDYPAFTLSHVIAYLDTVNNVLRVFDQPPQLVVLF